MFDSLSNRIQDVFKSLRGEVRLTEENVEAALRVAKKLGPGKRVVTLIPDAAERYMSKGIFSKWAKPLAPDHSD